MNIKTKGGLVQVPLYVKKDTALKLHEIKFLILEGFDINKPISVLIREAICEYLKCYFPDDVPIEESVTKYILSREEEKQNEKLV